MSRAPRVKKKKVILRSLQPALRLDAAKRSMPAPIRKKKPGAQKWVSQRIRKDRTSA
jgi:hypothetical protein